MTLTPGHDVQRVVSFVLDPKSHGVICVENIKDAEHIIKRRDALKLRFRGIKLRGLWLRGPWLISVILDPTSFSLAFSIQVQSSLPDLSKILSPISKSFRTHVYRHIVSHIQKKSFGSKIPPHRRRYCELHRSINQSRL
jgi:hypothetical protein